MKRTIGLAALMLSSCGGHSAATNGTQAGNGTPAATASANLPAAPAAEGNGPFGLDLNAGPDALPVDMKNSTPDKGLYILTSVPNPNSSFQTYAVVAYKGIGICEIRAISPNFDGDNEGMQVRGAADALAQALDTKYGKGKHTDECGNTCEPEFWSMSMGEGDRIYDYEWRPKGQGSPRSVILSVDANSITPFMRIDYAFHTDAECDAAKRKAVSSNL